MQRAPAVVLRFDDRVDAQHQRGRHEHCAKDVGAAPEADPRIPTDEPHREQGGRGPDREVDEEDPVPVDRLRDHAAGQQPDRCAGRGDEAEDADRPCLLRGLGEHRHDHAEDHRRGHRAARSLNEPGDDQ